MRSMNRMRARLDALDTVSVMRLGLLTLAVGAVVVTAAELAFLQHWDGTLKLLPWVALLAAAVGVLLLVVRPSHRAVWAARVLGAVCLVLGLMGVYFASSGLRRGHPRLSLHRRVAHDVRLDRWWLAATGGVGPTRHSQRHRCPSPHCWCCWPASAPRLPRAA